MRIFFATGNEHKISQESTILTPLGYEVGPLLIDGKTLQFIEPQAEGIEEVALSKIEQAREFVMGTKFEGSLILVEDSGLFIDSLEGFPGPYSSYVEGTIGLSGILQLMSGELERGAEFRTVAAISIEGNTVIHTGICRGKISEKLLGDLGFGYDPIFIPDDGDGRTCAELTTREKSSISHRGRALKAVSDHLNLPSK